MHQAIRTISLATLLSIASPLAAAAAERLCDPQFEDCRAELLNLIRNEQVGIDVAFWYMTDARYFNELRNRFNAGVPVRIIVDQRANVKYPHNATILQLLRDAGIPMREKFAGEILHFKMMLFHGQNMVEFSKSNYGGYSFTPEVPNVNYDDEAIFFTNEDDLTNSFRRRFDDLWTSPSPYRDFANISGPPVRSYPLYDIHPSMNFPPTEDFGARSVSRYDAESLAIDVFVYRVTDERHADAMIRAVQRGVPVRLITEPSEYRNADKASHSMHIDRMYMAGVQIKHRKHEGITHQASVVMHGLGEVIFGSSNWTPHSAYLQDEHNYFYKRDASNGRPWIFDWFAAQFDRRWSTTANYVPFQPLPPGTPSYVAPVNLQSALPASVTLRWDGGTWAHFYDIYLGTTPNPPLLASNLKLGSPSAGYQEQYTVSGLVGGTTYYWRIVGKTWAGLGKSGPTWSFTTSGTPPGGGGLTPYGGTPAAIPGTFEAENFDVGGQSVAYYDVAAGNSGGVYRPTEDVDIQATSDAGGGYNVGWTKAGEWLKYTVNVAATRTYKLEARVANAATGATFRVEVDGVDLFGSIVVPNTGGDQTWQTVTTPPVSLTAGQRVVRVVFVSTGTGSGVGNYNWFRFVESTSLGGTAVPLPGILQAERYDVGGQGVAYHDTTAGNSGNVYRSDDVDIGSTADPSSAGFYVGWTRVGEWLKYSVNVTETRTYTATVRLANVGSGATFRVEVDGVDRTGPIVVPNTGGWDVWQTVPFSLNGVLNGGTHVIRLVMLTKNAETAGSGNYGYLQFEASAPPPPPPPTTPYGGTPAALPGLVQTENFDEGAPGVAYFDASSWNSGDVYRSTGVDIGLTGDALSGGYYVGWMRVGEWLKYTVNVTQTRSYTLNVRVANAYAGATFRVEADGVDLTGPIAVPNTGGWDRWQTISVTGISLTEGLRVIRLVMVAPNVGNAGVGNYGYLSFE